MTLVNFKNFETKDIELKIDKAIAGNSRQDMIKLIKENEYAGMYILSKEAIAREISDKTFMSTYAHEVVRLRKSCAIVAMKDYSIWSISDNTGWSVGHEAVRSHFDVALQCLNHNDLRFLMIPDNKGVIIAKTIYQSYQSQLSENNLKYLRNIVSSQKTSTVTSNVSTSENLNEATLKPKSDINISVTDLKDLKSSIRNQVPTASTLNDAVLDNKDDLEKLEINSLIIDMVKKGKTSELENMLKSDNLFASYIISNKIGLDMIITSEGHTIAHYLAGIDEGYALRLIQDPQIATISSITKYWSVCHEAALHHKEAAYYAMNSENNLWEISDYKGRSVGHTAVRHHKDIAILAITSKNAKKLLLVEDDNETTIAHVGTYWTEFALFTLNEPELYKLTDLSGKTVAIEAVRQHFSSAKKVLQNPQKYISELGNVEGNRLILLAKNKLSELKK